MSDAEQQPPTGTVDETSDQPNENAEAPHRQHQHHDGDGVRPSTAASGAAAAAAAAAASSADDGIERPSKRRRLTDSLTPQQRPSPRAVSPPWKKFSAEGPTTFTDPNGKRRSGRTNALPLDLQPTSAKRRTRASITDTASAVRSKYSSTPQQARAERAASHARGSASRHTRTASRASLAGTPKSPRRASQHAGRESIPSTPVRGTLRRKSSAASKNPSVESPRTSARQRRMSSRAMEAERWNRQGRRSSRRGAIKTSSDRDHRSEEEEEEDHDDELDSDRSGSDDPFGTDVDDLPVDPSQRTPKLKLKVTPHTLGTPSYGNTMQYARDVRTQWTKRQFSSMEDWLSWTVEHGHQVFPGYDVYEGDDEYLKEVIDDYDERRRNRELSKQTRGPVVPLTRADARQEAELRLEVEEALEPGGKLHPDTSTQLAPEKFDIGRRQYGHWDHVVNHAINFRTLLNREQRKHREAARRLAYAARDKWQAIQPKSQDEIEQEKEEAQRAIVTATLRQCIRDMSTKWDLIRAELEKIRLARWEKEQEALGKKALNKVMEQSALLLDARRKLDTSDIDSNSDAVETDSEEDASSDGSGNEMSENDGADDEEEEENMSSSGSESDEAVAEEVIGDESLTVEELRRKYAEAEVEDLDRPPDRLLGVKDEEALSTEGDTEAAVPLQNGGSADVDAPETPPGAPLDEPDEAARRMYEQMSDDSDESIDMSEEESSDGSDDDSDDDGDSDSEGSEEEVGLFSLIATKSDLKQAKSGAQKAGVRDAADRKTNPAHVNGRDTDEEELEEVSLIPDAAQVQTPAASNDEGGPEPYRSEQMKERRTNLSIVTSSSPKPATPEPDLMLVEDRDEKAEDLKSEREDSRQDDVRAEINDVHTVEKQKKQQQLHDDDDGEQHDSKMSEELDLPATPVSSNAVKTPVPGLLRATLREYQHFGLDWLAGLYAKDTNGILADEMGLGKTIQTISLLAHIAEVHGVWGPHLIVVPTSVMLNWEIEFKKFLPGFKVLVYYGTPEERKNKRKGWLDDDKWNVVITSYQLVLQDQASFKRRGWHYMVLDEAHNIKNWKSARWQTLLGFRTSHRLLLTGTPLQNNLTELWSLMFFLMPYSEDESGRPQFTGLEEFTSWFNKPVNQIMEQGRGELTDEARELVRRLHTILRPYILRRLKADVEKQMPAKYEHVVYCKLSKRQRHLYDGFMSRASTRETLSSGNYLSIINCLMQLRKVCNHPDLFETRQIVTSYAMPKPATADFEIKDLLLRRRLLKEDNFANVNLDVLNLVPAKKGPLSALKTIPGQRVGAVLRLKHAADEHRSLASSGPQHTGMSVGESLEHMKTAAHEAASDKLESQWMLMNMRRQEEPLMDHRTVNFIRRKLNEPRMAKQEFTLPVPDGDVTALQHYRRRHAVPLPPQPVSGSQYVDWLDYCTPVLKKLTPSLVSRAAAMRPFVKKFGCITPAAIAHGVDALACGKAGIQVVEELRASPVSSQNAIAKVEPFHEAQTRLSIAFPDKRLLQYDCGKLQRLDGLLRTLQAGGHRALIFTQMTKVLDLLEQFLNIHGHRYLRLDGSTKIEQRQILTDRFNNDTRILAFILSSRSGGLGINLTGADTVIFYDLDWNPAMDKQCQDRCHRIGQTRDVHIYRFVSEYTIEANILRKANQKRLLDDVIIQDGDFTTDHFKNVDAHEADNDDSMHEADAEASAAMDRVLGGGSSGQQMSTKLLAQAEDKEDIAAANLAEKEGHADDADFDEKPSGTTTRADTPKASEAGATLRMQVSLEAIEDDKAEFFSGSVQPRTEAALQIFAEKAGIGIDRHILEHLEWELKDVPIGTPDDKRKQKKKRGRKSEQYSTKKRR